MLFYQLVIICCLLVFLGILLWNLKELPSLPRQLPTDISPFVSVLVPARNEENNIESCITSLLHQDYNNYELIVLNDGSNDRTREILEELQRSNIGSRLRIIEGKPLPDGWHGKAWASDQLGKAARGELLLFTDADTFHSPDSLSRSVAAMEESGADMLSLTPEQKLESFWERLVVPLMYVILFCYLPLRLVRISSSPAFCFAIGQFIMCKRKMYRLINGHQAVKNDLVDDVWLCKSVKKAGGKVVVYNGLDVVRCRMYCNLKDIWQGFSKNLFAGLAYNTFGLFALMLMTAGLYIVPYFFVLTSLAGSDFSLALFWLPLVQILIALLCRLLIAHRFHQPIPEALLHVFSQIVLLGIAVNSFYLITFGDGAQWKGRRYNFSGRRV